ncbi:MAG: MerR family transcriptional regulator [Bacillus sp. (in: firmicutes)]
MNIKVVSERTGLTKKAIKYYEEVNLITVEKNAVNNYREYSQENITTLRLISSLRLLHFSIEEIKVFLQGEKNIKTLLSEQLDCIKIELDDINRRKLLTEMLMNRLDQSEDFTSIAKELNKTLALSETEKKEYLSDQLKRIFPGSFGMLISQIYEPFLKVHLEDEAMKTAWLRLIQLLDDMDEVQEKVETESWDNQTLVEHFKTQQPNPNFIEELISNDSRAKQQLKDMFCLLIENLKTMDNVTPCSIEKGNLPNFKQGSPFHDSLIKISPKYAEFVKVQNNIIEEISKEKGIEAKVLLNNFI